MMWIMYLWFQHLDVDSPGEPYARAAFSPFFLVLQDQSPFTGSKIVPIPKTTTKTNTFAPKILDLQ